MEYKRNGGINAYLVDFYKHGQMSTIIQDNEIRPDEAYEIIKDFTLTLKGIAVALKLRAKIKEDPVVLAFEYLADTYNMQFVGCHSDYK